ncbi:MAG: STN domain-containing protein [Chryseolinea sp.]
MRILLLTLFLSTTLTLYAQVDLSRQVTINVKEVHVAKLFEILETRHGLVIAFGIDNIPATLKISLSATNKTIYEILRMICSQAGLTYQIIDNAIVFKYARPVTVQKADQSSGSTTASFSEAKDSSLHVPTNTALTPVDSLPVNSIDSSEILIDPSQTEVHSYEDQQIVESVPMKLPEVPSLFSTSKKHSKLGFYGAGIFFSYAMDDNHFRFVERDIAYQQYEVDWNYSMSMGGYVIVSSKLYVSLGVGYATKDFALNYHYNVLDPDDPFPIPDKTKVQIRYLEVPLTVGYGIYNRRKLSLCVAAGLYPSYLIEKRERTTYLNTGNPTTDYFINDNRSTLYSATLGFIVHYSVSGLCGIFVEPGYLFFPGAVNKRAMEPNASLYRIKTGIQFSLHPKK